MSTTLGQVTPKRATAPLLGDTLEMAMGVIPCGSQPGLPLSVTFSSHRNLGASLCEGGRQKRASMVGTLSELLLLSPGFPVRSVARPEMFLAPVPALSPAQTFEVFVGCPSPSTNLA